MKRLVCFVSALVLIGIILVSVVADVNHGHGPGSHGEATHGEETHGEATHGEETHGETPHGEETHGRHPMRRQIPIAQWKKPHTKESVSA